MLAIRHLTGYVRCGPKCFGSAAWPAGCCFARLLSVKLPEELLDSPRSERGRARVIAQTVEVRSAALLLANERLVFVDFCVRHATAVAFHRLALGGR